MDRPFIGTRADVARISAQQRESRRRRLDEDLDRVAAARLPELRDIWRAKLGVDPPPLRSREIFRRMLGYRLQAAAYGDLTPAARRKLDAIETRRTQPARRRPSPLVRLTPGAVLIREWKGVRHEVHVTADGFRHQGAVYRSLSEVARAIAGSRWNGPLFFGLRTPTRARA